MKNIFKFFETNKKYLILILPAVLSIVIILIFLVLKIDVSVFLEYEF